MPQANSKKKGGSAPAAEPETQKTHTLPNLVKSLGTSTEEEVRHYTEGMSKEELTYEGTRVGTERIDTDAARLYGIASSFFKTATDDQLNALMGVSADHVRVGAWAAFQGSQLYEALQKNKRKGGGTKEQLAIVAEKARSQAMVRRKALRTGLSVLAAGDDALLAQIDHANGTAKEPKSLSEALSALADVGEQMLQKPSAGLKLRLAKSRLTKAMLDQDRALATQVRETGDEAQAVLVGGEISQSTVDYWDGINLFLLGSLIDVFESGHALDPAIPRLNPIALLSYYSRRRTAKQAPATPEKPAGAEKPA